jgi:hypothetical protein
MPIATHPRMHLRLERKISNDTSSKIKVVQTCPFVIHPRSLSCTVQRWSSLGILSVCLKPVLEASTITTKHLAASKLR